MNEIYVFDGGKGDILFVYEDSIVMKHKGALNALAMGIHGDKTIFYSDLTSIQFKKGGALLAGHIQFSLLGGRESTGGVFAAAADENTITFDSDMNDMAEKVVAYIENKIRETRAAKNAPVQVQAAAPVSVADELIKFKQLLDMGVISQEEFDNKKAELMGGGQSASAPNTAANNTETATPPETKYTLTIQQKGQFYLTNSDISVSIDGCTPKLLKNGGDELVVELTAGEHKVEFSFSFRKTEVIVYLNQNSKLEAGWNRATGKITVTPDANTNIMITKKK